MLSVNCQTAIKLLKFVSSQSTNPQDSLVYTWDCMYENHLVTSHSTHSHLSSLQQSTAVMVIKETIKLSPLFIHASQRKYYIGDSWGRQPSKYERIIDESCDSSTFFLQFWYTTIQVTMHGELTHTVLSTSMLSVQCMFWWLTLVEKINTTAAMTDSRYTPKKHVCFIVIAKTCFSKKALIETWEYYLFQNTFTILLWGKQVWSMTWYYIQTSCTLELLMEKYFFSCVVYHSIHPWNSVHINSLHEIVKSKFSCY